MDELEIPVGADIYLPIRMVDRKGPPQGVQCPFFMCAVCQAPVSSLDGGVWWACDDSDRSLTRQVGPFIAHKEDCSWTLYSFLRQVLDESTWLIMDTGLEEWLGQLVHNTEMSVEQDEDFPDRCEYVAPYPSQWRAGRFDG